MRATLGENVVGSLSCGNVWLMGLFQQKDLSRFFGRKGLMVMWHTGYINTSILPPSSRSRFAMVHTHSLELCMIVPLLISSAKVSIILFLANIAVLFLL